MKRKSVKRGGNAVNQRANNLAANSSQSALNADAQMQYCRDLSSALKAVIDGINDKYKRRINAEHHAVK